VPFPSNDIIGNNNGSIVNERLFMVIGKHKPVDPNREGSLFDEGSLLGISS
jgi:hypothetical protein